MDNKYVRVVFLLITLLCLVILLEKGYHAISFLTGMLVWKAGSEPEKLLQDLRNLGELITAIPEKLSTITKENDNGKKRS